jgi:hypothetical protein
LADGRGLEIRRLLGEDDLFQNGGRRDEPGHPQAGGENLREGSEADREIRIAQRTEGREELSLEAEFTEGLSSTTGTPKRSARSVNALRRSRDQERPVGFWKSE